MDDLAGTGTCGQAVFPAKRFLPTAPVFVLVITDLKGRFGGGGHIKADPVTGPSFQSTDVVDKQAAFPVFTRVAACALQRDRAAVSGDDAAVTVNGPDAETRRFLFLGRTCCGICHRNGGILVLTFGHSLRFDVADCNLYSLTRTSQVNPQTQFSTLRRRYLVGYGTGLRVCGQSVLSAEPFLISVTPVFVPVIADLKRGVLRRCNIKADFIFNPGVQCADVVDEQPALPESVRVSARTCQCNRTVIAGEGTAIFAIFPNAETKGAHVRLAVILIITLTHFLHFDITDRNLYALTRTSQVDPQAQFTAFRRRYFVGYGTGFLTCGQVVLSAERFFVVIAPVFVPVIADLKRGVLHRRNIEADPIFAPGVQGADVINEQPALPESVRIAARADQCGGTAVTSDSTAITTFLPDAEGTGIRLGTRCRL